MLLMLDGNMCWCDVYINKNPSDTIPVKYSTVQQLKETITKLEYLYKANKKTIQNNFQVEFLVLVLEMI